MSHWLRRLVCGGLIAALGGIILLAAARDAKPPGVARAVVLENERVRAQVIHYPAGARGTRHRHHVPRVIVVLEGGRLEILNPDGERRTLELETGTVAWRPAEEHTLINAGSTSVRLVEIDLLEPADR